MNDIKQYLTIPDITALYGIDGAYMRRLLIANNNPVLKHNENYWKRGNLWLIDKDSFLEFYRTRRFYHKNK